MESYEKKKAYNRKWTEANTKNVTIRFKKDDDVWQMLEVLKANDIKMNALFKEAVINEYNKLKQ